MWRPIQVNKIKNIFKTNMLNLIHKKKIHNNLTCIKFKLKKHNKNKN